MKAVAVLAVLSAFLAGALPAHAWTWPVEGPVLQPFQFGDDPYGAGLHRGIDIAASAGAGVLAPAPGLITFAGTVPRGGRTVTIETSEGYAVTLLHLGSLLVERGRGVAEGEPVGTVGPSGEAEHAEPYVHLGVRLAGDPHGYVDPLTLLPPLPAPPLENADEPAQEEPAREPAEQETVEGPAPEQPAAVERDGKGAVEEDERGETRGEEAPGKATAARTTTRVGASAAAAAGPGAEGRGRAQAGAPDRAAKRGALREVSLPGTSAYVRPLGAREARTSSRPAARSTSQPQPAPPAQAAGQNPGREHPVAEVLVAGALVLALTGLAAAWRVRRPRTASRAVGHGVEAIALPPAEVEVVRPRRFPEPCVRRRSPRAVCGRLAGCHVCSVKLSLRKSRRTRRLPTVTGESASDQTVTRSTAARGRGARSAREG